MSLDIGTGDGRLPYTLARQAPGRLYVGLDANAAGLRELSGRAFRAGLANVLYVRAAVEDLPPPLAGLADSVTIVLPWGSLLATVALPGVSLLRGIRALCQPGATLTVVLGIDPDRDRSEAQRLGLASLVHHDPVSHLSAGYRAAGFALTSVRQLRPEELALWPSTWARRLARRHSRFLCQLEAKAAGDDR